MRILYGAYSIKSSAINVTRPNPDGSVRTAALERVHYIQERLSHKLNDCVANWKNADYVKAGDAHVSVTVVSDRDTFFYFRLHC